MKLSARHDALLEALEANGSCADFAKRYQEHAANVSTFDAILDTFPKRSLPRLCAALAHQVEFAASILHGQHGGGHNRDITRSPNGSKQAQVESAETPEQSAGNREGAETALHGAAVLAQLLMTMMGPGSMPEALTSAACTLHDQCLLAAPGAPALNEAVARLCCKAWATKASCRDALVTQTLPYLIIKAHTSGLQVDVKKCHSIREALSLLDFDDPSIADMRHMLLRAALAPSFLRSGEGRRFLGFLFTLHPQMVRELTAIIRNQVPSGRKSILDAYAEVIFQAWRHTQGACRFEVEHTLLQGLMQAAMVASTPAMGAAIRRVLSGLHSQKMAPGMDATLLRLYEPLIFRAAAAANPAVRCNAVQALVAAFPLHDPAGGMEQTDALLTRQFATLATALGDVVPGVRIVAIDGVCTVLDRFWELIPSGTTAVFIKRLTSELAFDGSSAGVRAAVVNGLARLAPNALAGPLLAAALPQLRLLMSDGSQSVRIAMADLLLTLRSLQVVPFYDVVPVDVLLEQLGSGGAAIARRMQRLVLPFYFSDPAEGPARVAHLLRSNPAAGRAFCEFLIKGRSASGNSNRGCGVPIEEVIQLATALGRHLLNTAPSRDQACVAKGKRSAKHSAKAKPVAAGTENVHTPAMPKRKRRAPDRYQADATSAAPRDQPLEAESQEAWESILGGFASLCASLAGECAAGGLQHSDVKPVIPQGMLTTLLAACASDTAVQAVLAMAADFSFLAAASSVRAKCLKQVLSDRDSKSCSPTLTAARLACICSSTSERDRLLQAVFAALDPDEDSQPHALDGISCAHGVWLLGLLLESEGTRHLVLDSPRLPALLKTLGSHADVSVTDLVNVLAKEPENSNDSTADAPIAILTCARAAVHAALKTSPPHADQPPALSETDASIQAAAVAAVSTAIQCGARLVEALREQVGPELAAAHHAAAASAVPPAPARKSRKKAAASQKGPCRLSSRMALESTTDALAALLGLLADAMRLMPQATSMSVAVGACSFARQALEWAACLSAAAREETAQSAAASLLARAAQLACAMSAASFSVAAHRGMDESYRDLGVIPLSPVEENAPSDGTVVDDVCSAHEALLTALMQVVFNEDADAALLGTCRPFLPSIVAMLRDQRGLREAPWLVPVAALLAESAPCDPQQDADAVEDQEEQTAKHSRRRRASPAGREGPTAHSAAGGSAVNSDHTAIKALLQAATVAKANDALQAAALACATSAPTSTAALGSIRLAILAGLKPLPARHARTAMGPGTHGTVSIVEQIKQLQQQTIARAAEAARSSTAEDTAQQHLADVLNQLLPAQHTTTFEDPQLH